MYQKYIFLITFIEETNKNHVNTRLFSLLECSSPLHPVRLLHDETRRSDLRSAE